MSAPTPQPSRWAIWLPLALFGAIVVLVAIALYKPADKTVTSQLVGKAMPQFNLPAALPGRPGLDSKILANGKPHLVNIFASWCIPCGVEAPQLAALAKAGVPIEGISVRDSAQNLTQFLDQHGDPYQRIGADDDGQIQLALGSSGVPETYVVDGQGRIVYQHIGEIRPEHLELLMGKLKDAGA
ncbi:cytochrome c biogenesis protein CcmG,thiol:disulfide interchange protein DsbE [Novosphingobium sp. Rr 2-17]|uniref:DsbE family thiol:disulfide interchange protein n=1 Tax=Novosphingobium sp. Rr 2-17 TaxID=555793 RepID=UPI000269925E|nr:DsbE family thiol:disulfide interchange protein [Novosphingobium sp. Rr 2-17]EIZ77552.1 cytochrome c biogenesis protein CcmG,thiol:disulfide interchange protein DsbE [Novosphingobium sp. Rr 2-17]